MLKSFKLKLISFIILSCLLFVGSPSVLKAQDVESMILSKGVEYHFYQGTYLNNQQALRHLTVDLNDPFTIVDVSYPFPLNQLSKTTSKANSYTGPGKQVVGAINGSFFWGSNEGNLPMYLIAYRNQLINAGIISSGTEYYVNQPIAFGVDKNGRAMIDSYNLELTFSQSENGHYPITSTDKFRSTDNLILYTPLFPNATTETNELGIEVAITGIEDTEINFGETLTGQVSEIRQRGDKNPLSIPKNGFVLSAHGNAMNAIKDLKINDTVSISANIDEKWKDAAFMLTSGPSLVKNGNVSLGIDPSSSRAKEIAPRTAIATDKTGTKVFMVTVDGRQTASKGMNLKEFADYLVSIGAYNALNLDGGGSTTLAARKPGDFNVSLFNKPSDGFERNVSTALFAVSTAPEGNPSVIEADLTANGVYLKGTKGTVNVTSVLDNYYNPLNFKRESITLTSSEGLINATGLSFTAVKVGKGFITAQYGTAIKKIPFEVIDSIEQLKSSKSSLLLKNGEVTTIAIDAYDQKNRKVIYDASLIKWQVDPNIGHINSKGVFTAGLNAGKGTITATLGNKSIQIPVSVNKSEPAILIDSMETTTNWNTRAINGDSAIFINSTNEPAYQGNGAVKLAYNFTGFSGTSAAYLEAKQPIRIEGTPNKISARIFGDAGNTWVRGRIIDSNQREHTINFTAENGLKWIGWNYVSAEIPSGIHGDIYLKEIYLAQPTDSLKTRGAIMIDDIKAVYQSSYKEGLFKDTGINFRAENEINYLVNQGIIAGYNNGTFQPYQNLTRLQAAILLSRALSLPTDQVKKPNFTDIDPNDRFYNEVAAVANAGIIQGKEKGKIFDPNGYLTRAEMAAILQRGFKLPMTKTNHFTDISGSFARDYINSLAYNGISQGIGEGKFGPGQNISRVDFSVFLYRSLSN